MIKGADFASETSACLATGAIPRDKREKACRGIMTTVERAPRVYAATSVFGGCFDKEFVAESERFFEEIRRGQFVLVISQFVLVISNVTLDELALAPEAVRQVLAALVPQAS